VLPVFPYFELLCLDVIFLALSLLVHLIWTSSPPTQPPCTSIHPDLLARTGFLNGVTSCTWICLTWLASHRIHCLAS
jgi:hypothetical protein